MILRFKKYCFLCGLCWIGASTYAQSVQRLWAAAGPSLTCTYSWTVEDSFCHCHYGEYLCCIFWLSKLSNTFIGTLNMPWTKYEYLCRYVNFLLYTKKEQISIDLFRGRYLNKSELIPLRYLYRSTCEWLRGAISWGPTKGIEV